MLFPKKLRKRELRALVIGMVLGDAHLTRISGRGNSSICLGHSLKQKNYYLYKKNLLETLLKLKFNTKEFTRNNKYQVIQGKSNTNRYLGKIRNILYKDNKKIINYKILSYLDHRALAIWFMDAGGKRVNHKRKYINGLFLSTQSFSKQENEIIQKFLLCKFNLKSSIVSHGKNKVRLNFNKENSLKLKALINQFILPEFNYKLILDYKDISTVPSEELDKQK
jgi:hypothetical protein